MTDVTHNFQWRKSSRSNGANGNCVEVGTNGAVIGVRDTKCREGGTLLFDPATWRSFIDAVRTDAVGR